MPFRRKPLPRRRDIRRVLLIFPPERTPHGFFRANVPPLGLMYLAAAIRDHVDVEIIDARCEGYENVVPAGDGFVRTGLSWEQIADRVRAFQPDLVGVNVLASFNYPEARELARCVKNVSEDILTVLGGVHVTYLPAETLNDNPAVDFVIAGEGERAFRSLIENLSRGEPLTDIGGLSFQRGDEDPHINTATTMIEDLDTLPFPARDLVPMEKYHETAVPFSRTYKHRRNTTMITSRGCPAKCTFCSSAKYWGYEYRGRHPERVLDEIEHLITEYGIREIHFIDDNITYDMKRAAKIFQGMIERQLKVHWSTPNGIAVWRLTPELLHLMKDSGCYELTLAIESGSQDVMNSIVKKPLNLEKAAHLCSVMQDIGIRTHAFFQCGFPGETLDDIRRTFRFARRLNVDSAYFFISNPLPGTELYDVAAEHGFLKEGFSFDNIEYSIGYIETDEFSAEELQKLVHREYFAYNLRLAWRHPLRFFDRYGRTLLSNPVASVTHLRIPGRLREFLRAGRPDTAESVGY